MYISKELYYIESMYLNYHIKKEKELLNRSSRGAHK